MATRTRFGRLRLPPALARFRAARAGVAAVEFALILPVMLLLWFGMIEVTVALNVDRKVTILSRTVADLVGRETAATEQEIRTIFNAAIAVMAPYEHANVEIVVSSVGVAPTADGDPVASVCWSLSRLDAARKRQVDEPVPLPAGFDQPNTSFILAEVFVPYRPIIGSGIVGEITLSERTVWPVRKDLQVRLDGQQCSFAGA